MGNSSMTWQAFLRSSNFSFSRLFAVRIIGTVRTLIILSIAPSPPRSSRPKTPSTSSMRIIFPCNRSTVKESSVTEVLAGVSIFNIVFSVLTSLAFISTTRKWLSFAEARTSEVFPIPGGPTNRTAFFGLRFVFHARSQMLNSEIASSLPISAEVVVGRYFSAHAMLSCMLPICLLAG